MAKDSRDVSMRGTTYEVVKRCAKERGQSNAAFLDQLVNAKLDELKRPTIAVVGPGAPRVTGSGRFTF